MTRKMIDCREMPSESNCSLTIVGEEDEVIRAAAQHAADVHGHPDDEELRSGLRSVMQDASELDTNPGAFVQMIEFHTSHIDEVEETMDDWVDAIGARRTARWGVVTADRESPETYVEFVEFPNYDRAMANSENPVTAQFADQLRKLSEGEPVFRNLDVRRVFV